MKYILNFDEYSRQGERRPERPASGQPEATPWDINEPVANQHHENNNRPEGA